MYANANIVLSEAILDEILDNYHVFSPFWKRVKILLTIVSSPISELKYWFVENFHGHSLLEACRQGDSTRIKRIMQQQHHSGGGGQCLFDLINFSHAYTGDFALHVLAKSIHVKKREIAAKLLAKGVRLNERNKE